MNQLKYTLLICGVLLATTLQAGRPKITINPVTGSIASITLSDDPTGMNWLLATDGSQYEWIQENYSWGLGYLTVETDSKRDTVRWNRPLSLSADGMEAVYDAGGIRVIVSRRYEGDDLVERYTLRNHTQANVTLRDIGIFTPFNDNYPDAATCMTQRAHAHVWAEGTAAYVCALRMGAKGPHLGLALTRGSLHDYDIWERGQEKGNSQTRGVIALGLPEQTLEPEEEVTMEWRLFEHQGWDDFEQQLLKRRSVLARCNQYTFELGDTVHATLESRYKLKKVFATAHGEKYKVRLEKGRYRVDIPVSQPGNFSVIFHYNNGGRAVTELAAFNRFDELIARRVEFIRTHQQMKRTDDPRYGAYLPYDNETDSLLLDPNHSCSPTDRNEGAERVGMGVLLAKCCQLTGDTVLLNSLIRYTDFVRNKLQDPDYVTYSNVTHNSYPRAYNYPWIAELQLRMYLLTGQTSYAYDGYRTLRTMFNKFGHGFYAIGIPVTLSMQVLEKAGLTQERDSLWNDYAAQAAQLIKNGTNYPKHEVNYEQSIAAPAVQFLSECYLVSHDTACLNEARRQMPILEAFCGRQPSCYLNGIAIRHWDGYWFGKSERYGDTFPHYWSTLNASAYYYYALASGNSAKTEEARQIVRNNLLLFAEDGKGYCAFLYPRLINGQRARGYDALANDQDWALVYYLLVNKNI